MPLSFAGTWYGATGWLGQVLLFGAIGWVVGYAAHNFQRGRFRPMAFLPIGMSVLIGVLSIQYSSRMVWRIISIAVFLLVVAYLVRDRRGTDERPPEALVSEAR